MPEIWGIWDAIDGTWSMWGGGRVIQSDNKDVILAEFHTMQMHCADFQQFEIRSITKWAQEARAKDE